MESSLVNAVVIIATGSAIIKFALFEWESIIHAWLRVRKLERPTNSARCRKTSIRSEP
jgi:hypothetical protein